MSYPIWYKPALMGGTLLAWVVLGVLGIALFWMLRSIAKGAWRFLTFLVTGKP